MVKIHSVLVTSLVLASMILASNKPQTETKVRLELSSIGFTSCIHQKSFTAKMDKNYIDKFEIHALTDLYSLSFSCDVQPNEAAVRRTWTVDDDGVADFHKIQEAVDIANPGDTIFVYAGKYFENVIIDKSIFLVGENSSTTKIDGGKLGSALQIRADNTVVSGFMLQAVYGAFHVVYVDRADHVIISKNVFHGGFTGIFFYYSENNVVSENEFSMIFDYGVLLGGYCSNTVIINNIVKNTWYGIGLWNSSDNVVYNNTVEQTGKGPHPEETFEPSAILLYDNSKNNHAIGNRLFNNGWNGVAIAEHCSQNFIINNMVALSSHYGVWIGENSAANFFQRNFFDNEGQVYIENGNNAWDDGKEGNYWSDYNGTDSNGDGIGDMPYQINENNVDNCPLMKPWTPPSIVGDVNHDGAVNIADVIIVCVIYAREEGDPGWIAEADIAPPYGIIEICDVVTVCANYGRTYSMK